MAKYSAGAWDDMANSNRYFASGAGWVESNYVSTFSPFTIGTVAHNNTLPVDWLSFEVKQIGEKVNLKWATSNEVNNSHFEIERSDDNIDFENIATIQLEKNSNGNTRTYSFLDEGVNQLKSKLIYYRLRQVDRNGKSSLSETQFVIFNNHSNLVVYPNPAINKVIVKTNNSIGLVEFRTYFGELVFSERVTNLQAAVELDLSALSQGVYFVNFITQSGSSRVKLFRN